MTAALSTASITAFAAEIPRESTPLNATEEQIVIAENIIRDILDEVAAGNLGYTEAAGEANTRIRKAYICIYRSVNPSFNPDEWFLKDYCYTELPAVDPVMYNRARKLLMDAKEVYEKNNIK